MSPGKPVIIGPGVAKNNFIGIVSGKSKRKFVEEQEQRRKKLRLCQVGLYDHGCKILPPLRPRRHSLLSCIACGMAARTPVNCTRTNCPGFVCIGCCDKIGCNKSDFECGLVPDVRFLPRTREPDHGALELSTHFSNYRLSYGQAARSGKLIYDPNFSPEHTINESSTSDEGTFTSRENESQINVQSVCQKLANAPTVTSFDKLISGPRAIPLENYLSLNRKRVKTKRGSQGVAIAHHCVFCDELIPADAQSTSLESQSIKQRHWIHCKALLGSNGNPLLALKNKADSLNSQHFLNCNRSQGTHSSFSTTTSNPANTRPAPDSTQQLGVSRTTATTSRARSLNIHNRKRSHPPYCFDPNLTLEDIRILNMAKVKKINLRYQVYDRGKK